MKIGFLSLILSASITLAADEFSQYLSEGQMIGSPKNPKFDTPFKKKYQTRIREGLKNGPNFNGHYAISYWGCGSNCLEFAITDLQTGRVFALPDSNSIGVQPKIDSSGNPIWIQFKLNSRLFYVFEFDLDGICKEKENMRSSYLFEDNSIKHLKTECEK